MPICHNNKLIFIHIPKTGGTSIEHTLGLLDKDHLFSFKRSVISMPEIAENFQGLEKNIILSITPQHLTSCHLQKIVKNYDLYTKFTIIRNPYDRVVSEYHYIKTMPHKIFNKYKNISFLNFLHAIFDDDNMSNFIRISLFDNHLTSQYDFLSCFDFNNDVYFRFENIKETFEWLKAPMQHKNKSTNKSNYKNYYCQEAKKIVNRAYEKDIDFFKYIF